MVFIRILNLHMVFSLLVSGCFYFFVNILGKYLGNLRGFDEIRPAITIGIFENENSDDFKTFHNLAEIYRGRYHFAYFIKTGLKILKRNLQFSFVFSH